MNDVLELSASRVDLARREVRRGGETLPLSELEVELLSWLSSRPGRPADRDELLVKVWGFPRPVQTRAVDNTVMRLRAKIERDPTDPQHLITIRGRGYLLELPAAPLPQPAPPAPPAISALSEPPTPFFGRGEELARLEALVAGGARLVSLIGPGGSGKTRLLARWLAAREAAGDPGGTRWVIPLADVRERADLLRAVAGALGLPLAGDAALVGRALAAAGPAVLALDNLEQLLPHLPQTLGAWLAAAPELQVVATSRRRLRLALSGRSEEVLAVGPLSADDAAALLADRLRRVRAGPAEGAGFKEILASLQGHPLSIELLAARAGALDLADLAARLSQQLRLLRGGPADGAPRHASLEATLRWSWDLLSPAEQRALAACGAFEGGFDLDAAEAALDEGPGGSWPEDLLEALADASLLAREGGRYRLPVSVQEFARARLAERADRAEIEDKHAAFYAARSGVWAQRLDGPEGARWRRKLSAERANLRAAAAAVAPRAPGLAATLLVRSWGRIPALALEDSSLLRRAVDLAVEGRVPSFEATARTLLAFWLRDNGRNPEAEAELRRAAELVRAGATYPRIFRFLAQHLSTTGRLAEAAPIVEEGLAFVRRQGDVAAEADLLTWKGMVLHNQDRLGEAAAAYREAIACAQAAEDRGCETGARGTLAVLLMNQRGQEPEARRQLAEALRISEELGEFGVLAGQRSTLAWICILEGDLDQAATLAQASAAEARRLGLLSAENQGLGALAVVEAFRGNLMENLRILEECMALARLQQDPFFSAPLLAGLAANAARRGSLAEAETLFARARDALGDQRTPSTLQGIDLLEAFADLARARAAERAGASAEADSHRRAAQRRLREARPMADGSAYVRYIERLIEIALAERGYGDS